MSYSSSLRRRFLWRIATAPAVCVLCGLTGEILPGPRQVATIQYSHDSHDSVAQKELCRNTTNDR
eukprot:3425256-Pyramimonas_sp.AAC.1